MKICTKCKLSLPVGNFGSRKESKCGLRSSCKACIKKDRREYYKKYHLANREKICKRVYDFIRTERGRALHRATVKRQKKKTMGSHNNYLAARRANKLNATPAWLTEFDKAYIKNIYIQSRFLTSTLNEQHEVDHIVPLVSKVVCGLHVPWNLQIITAFENQSKGNKIY